ncbi:hypothetical protein [Nocardia pseudovaccinii]|uniref:hypothetical protein n=1 Tax=Nocardia pseudovaccinii TaxID=189540 RepID=UPI0007A3E2E2|nr:hypothetical protein [Nocardia pseudovaccinii]
MTETKAAPTRQIRLLPAWVLMAMLDNAIVGTAIPTIVRELRARRCWPPSMPSGRLTTGFAMVLLGTGHGYLVAFATVPAPDTSSWPPPRAAHPASCLLVHRRYSLGHHRAHRQRNPR